MNEIIEFAPHQFPPNLRFDPADLNHRLTGDRFDPKNIGTVLLPHESLLEPPKGNPDKWVTDPFTKAETRSYILDKATTPDDLSPIRKWVEDPNAYFRIQRQPMHLVDLGGRFQI